MMEYIKFWISFIKAIKSYTSLDSNPILSKRLKSKTAVMFCTLIFELVYWLVMLVWLYMYFYVKMHREQYWTNIFINARPSLKRRDLGPSTSHVPVNILCNVVRTFLDQDHWFQLSSRINGCNYTNYYEQTFFQTKKTDETSKKLS